MWTNALEDRGVEVSLTDAGQRVTITSGSRSHTWRLRHLRRSPRPSEILPDAVSEWLLWLPAVTKGLRRHLIEVDVSWVSDSGEIHLRTPWGLVTAEPPDSTARDPEVSGPALSPGARATMQFLLEHPRPATQRRISTAIGLSQPRVSQILHELLPGGLVTRTAPGWIIPEPDAALDIWLGTSESPAVLTMTWFSLAPPAQQMALLWHRAQAEHAEFRLCGDWAADLLAPWRPPQMIAAHADRSLDLADHGFVPAPADAATLVMHVGPVRPDWRPDPDVLAMMRIAEAPYPLAPVTEVIREIIAAGGTDAEQAVAEVRSGWRRARAATVASEAG